MAASLSAGRIWPWSSPTRRPASSSAASRSASAVADAASTRSEPSTSGQTTNARCPEATCSRTRAQASSTSSGVRSHAVVTGWRPGGSSSITVMSRSPKTTMAAVRGMGVAVMTSRSGSRPVPSAPRPLSRRAARCSTPKRCCSSITTTPSEEKTTASVRSAWVPTSRSTEPSASPPSTDVRSEAGVRLVRRATRNGRVPPNVAGSGTTRPSTRRRTSVACCSASTSVGAIRAPWCPPSIPMSRAATATTVLPAPTSPCRSRCMGRGPARSTTRSPTARTWAPVSGNGSPAVNCSTSVADPSGREVTWGMPRASSWSRRRRSTRASCSRKSSSKARRRLAGSTWAIDLGRWIPAKAVVRSTSRSSRRAGSGSGSANRPARSRASWTRRPIRAEVRRALSVSG